MELLAVVSLTIIYVLLMILGWCGAAETDKLKEDSPAQLYYRAALVLQTGIFVIVCITLMFGGR